MHPFVLGELAMGNLASRTQLLADLRALPAIGAALEDEVLGFIERQRLFGLGIGYVDAHFLAAVKLTAGARLWTFDKRLVGGSGEIGGSSRIVILLDVPCCATGWIAALRSR